MRRLTKVEVKVAGTAGANTKRGGLEMEKKLTLEPADTDAPVAEADTDAASPGDRSSPKWERSPENGGSANCTCGAVFGKTWPNKCAPPCSLFCAVAQLAEGLTPGRVGQGGTTVGAADGPSAATARSARVT